MATRPVAVVVTALTAACLLVSACSEERRYRTVSFFFDGVPKPGAPTTQPAAAGQVGPTTKPARRVRQFPQVVMTVHPPYQQNRCRQCHVAYSRGLFKSVEDGMCLTCHTDLTADMKYVHGPVAANACLICHHHHQSPRPRMLLAEGGKLCLQCHDEDELSTGPHHATLDDQPCTACHHAHGSDKKFFIRTK